MQLKLVAGHAAGPDDPNIHTSGPEYSGLVRSLNPVLSAYSEPTGYCHLAGFVQSHHPAYLAAAFASVRLPCLHSSGQNAVHSRLTTAGHASPARFSGSRAPAHFSVLAAPDLRHLIPASVLVTDYARRHSAAVYCQADRPEIKV